MLPAEQARSETLLELASRQISFPNLSPLEKQVLRDSCADEDPPDWSPPDTPAAQGDDRSGAASTDTPAAAPISPFLEPERSPTGRPRTHWQGSVVRSALLRWLLTDAQAASLLGRGGLRLWNARILEPLDLTGCHVLVRIRVRYCLMEAPFLLVEATLARLSIRNSTLQHGLDATKLELDGPLYLEDIVAAEVLRFDSATINGQARISDTLLSSTKTALSMDDATITNDLSLWPQLQAYGKLSLKKIKVGSDIVLNGAKLTTTEQALDLDGAKVQGKVFLSGLQSAGEIQIVNAEIDGTLDCTDAVLTANEVALLLNQVKITGDISLRDVFSTGEMRMLPKAQIGGHLDCRGARFKASKTALYLDDARIGGDVWLSSSQKNNFEADGLIRLAGGDIGGRLNCSRAKLSAKDESLILDGAKIHYGVFLDGGFEAAGTIRTRGAEIGEVRCDDASVGLFLGEKLEVKGDFCWTNIKKTDQTSLNLMGAQIRNIYFDRASLPRPGALLLNGLTIQELTPVEENNSLHPACRIAWLNCQPMPHRAEPRPWIQLAKLLEGQGYKRDARHLLFELRKQQAIEHWGKRYTRRWLSILFSALEEQPFRILVPIVLLAALSGATFTRYQNQFAPTNEAGYKTVYKLDSKCEATPNAQSPYVNTLADGLSALRLSHDARYDQCAGLPLAYPRFQPFVYALENVLPIVKLGQDDHWAPAADVRPSPFGLYWWLMGLRWFLILAGYVQGAVLAAAVSARFRA